MKTRQFIKMILECSFLSLFSYQIQVIELHCRERKSIGCNNEYICWTFRKWMDNTLTYCSNYLLSEFIHIKHWSAIERLIAWYKSILSLSFARSVVPSVTSIKYHELYLIRKKEMKKWIFFVEIDSGT
jgi:hypothetical protein